jgi:hypothetical protein
MMKVLSAVALRPTFSDSLPFLVLTFLTNDTKINRKDSLFYVSKMNI